MSRRSIPLRERSHEPMAHPQPDPTLPPDSVVRDVLIVTGAAAILVVLAIVAFALGVPDPRIVQ